MKESLTKITAWIKAHPIPAAIIGLVIVVIGYFIVRSSGGNSSGETIDGGSLGADEASPLVGLGGGDSISTGATPATDTTAPSYASDSTDISTPQAAESISTYAAPSDYINDTGLFSGPESAADVITRSTKPLSGGGIKNNLALSPAPSIASLAGISSAGQKKTLGGGVKNNLGLSQRMSIKQLVSNLYTPPRPSTSRGGIKGGKTFKRPDTQVFNLFKYVGTVAGYKWDSGLRRYVKLTTATKSLKAF